MTTETYDTLDLALTELVAREIAPSELPPTEEFLVRARQGARRAEALRRMSRAAQDLDFQAVPLPDFLVATAQRAGVHLARILPPASAGQTATSPWIYLARQIGLQLERIRLHVRLWVAERQSLGDASPLFARDGRRTFEPAPPPWLEGVDEAMLAERLRLRELTYDSEAKAELATYLNEVDEAE